MRPVEGSVLKEKKREVSEAALRGEGEIGRTTGEEPGSPFG